MFDDKPARHSASTPHPEAFRGAYSDVVQVRIVLIEIVPPIWRQLSVPVNLTLRRFHAVIQEAMGWKNLQPHRFRIGALAIGKPSGPLDSVKDSRWISIRDVLNSGEKIFHYDYGADANWVHQIRIDARTEGTSGNQRPHCVGGERACPPEDVSGPDDYVERLAVWEGRLILPAFRPAPGSRIFDPDRFDVNQVNAALSNLIL